MIKEKKETLSIINATTVVILIIGLLAILTVNVIPSQQAHALFGYSIPYPQGDQLNQQEERQLQGGGCLSSPNFGIPINASQGRCLH